jgi:HEAT repeat protein
MDDRYQIQEKIGQGGIGAVYRAIDGQLKREVALKRLLPQEGAALATDSETTDNLLKEATTLSALQHPNIVTIYDVGKDDKGPFVVMELLKGETFDETVERGALTEKDFRNVVSQTMEALVAAHHEGIVHRDLKPSNLMVNWLPSGKFQIKILDFGLAKFSKKPAVQTIDQSDAILGSIYFMAPEQFERVPLDARTDLYSIGSLYYYCLTTDYPFNGDSAAQVMAAHLQNRVQPLGQLRPDLPTWMCDWVMWLVSREMAHRPATAQQALDFFQSEQSGVVSAPQPIPGAPVLMPVAPAHAAHPPMAAGPQTAPLSGNAGGVAQGQLTGPLGFEEGLSGFPEGQVFPAKKFPVPMWAMITVPILLILLLVVSLTRSGAKRVIEERDAMVLALNESEVPRGDAETVAVFIEFIKDQPKKSNNEIGALGTLQRLQGAEVDQGIIDQLPQVSSRIRAALISVLTQRGVKSALPELLNYVGDPNSEVSDIAIYSIGVLGDASNVNTLISELKNPSSEEIANALVNSIILISQKSPDLSSRSKSVVSALKAASDGDFRYRLLRILGHLGGDDAWAELKKVLDGTNVDARKAALRGLNSWPDGSPAETLYEIARNEEDPIIKGHALRTFVLLLNAPSDTPDEDKVGRIKELLESEEPISRSVKRDLIGALAGLAVPEAQEIAETLKDDSTFGRYGQMASDQIAKTLGSRIEAAGGADLDLKTSKALTIGEGGFGYDASAGAVIGWTLAAYNVEWPIKFEAAGNYQVIVTASTPPAGGGVYEVTLGGSRLVGKTGDGKKFVENVLGDVKITAPGTYSLTVIGIGIDEPDTSLMRLRSVLLKAK